MTFMIQIDTYENIFLLFFLCAVVGLLLNAGRWCRLQWQHDHKTKKKNKI